MAIPKAAPVPCFAKSAMYMSSSMPNLSPMVVNIVPISNEANSPNAIALSASIKYLCTEISISFLFKKSLNVLLLLTP